MRKRQKMTKEEKKWHREHREPYFIRYPNVPLYASMTALLVNLISIFVQMLMAR